jgi:transcriptional regulator
MVYLPPVFTETRREVLLEHIEQYDFGLLVSHGPAGLVASHVPFLIERDGDRLYLQAHLARPNPQAADLAGGGEVLAIFHGPHAYVSPRWYATGPSVPTWNYVDVHAYGTVRLVEDEKWLRRFLIRLSGRHEAPNGDAWRMQDLPEAYLQTMLNGIVGLEIAVTRLEGKYKLSQNRPAADRSGVVAALEARPDAGSQEVSRLMRLRGGA